MLNKAFLRRHWMVKVTKMGKSPTPPLGNVLNPLILLLGILPKKCVLKLVEPFSGHCLTIKSWNYLQFVHFAAFWSRYKILASEGQACVESKILRHSESDTAVLTFSFRFLSSALLSLFLPHFFSFAWHLVGFILVGKVFGNAFRI